MEFWLTAGSRGIIGLGQNVQHGPRSHFPRIRAWMKYGRTHKPVAFTPQKLAIELDRPRENLVSVTFAMGGHGVRGSITGGKDH
jgi:hypothetical protein